MMFSNAIVVDDTVGGGELIQIGQSEERRLLEDGDEVLLRAREFRAGHVSIGFGEWRGIIQPAPARN